MNRSPSLYVPLSAGEPQAHVVKSPFESLTPRPTEGEPTEEGEPRNGRSRLAPSWTAPAESIQPFAPLHSEVTALSLTEYQLKEELAATKSKLDVLERQQRIREEEGEIAVAHAASTELGLFILHKVAETEDGVGLDEVAANLQGPEGWLAMARLMKAGLVDENGRTFYSTSAGEQVLEDIQKHLR